MACFLFERLTIGLITNWGFSDMLASRNVHSSAQYLALVV